MNSQEKADKIWANNKNISDKKKIEHLEKMIQHLTEYVRHLGYIVTQNNEEKLHSNQELNNDYMKLRFERNKEKI